ncbi:MAG: peptidylprolyl isomerase [Verrucomicrobiales bacterium]
MVKISYIACFLLSILAGPSSASSFPEVIAKVNGEEIPRADLEELLGLMLGGQPLETLEEEVKDGLVRSAVDRLVMDKLASQAARQEQIEPALAEEEFNRFASAFESAEEMTAELQSENKTIEDIQLLILNTLRQRQWMDSKLEEHLVVHDIEVQSFYNDNPQAAEVPERVRARHILLRTPPEMSPEDVETKREEINNLRARIVAGESFEVTAKELSQDEGSRDSGGDLGFFRRGEMVPEFEQAAFSLQPGEVSGPVQTNFGFHLIKVEEKSPSRKLEFEEAEPYIREYILDQRRRGGMQEILQGLREAAEIELFVP